MNPHAEFHRGSSATRPRRVAFAVASLALVATAVTGCGAVASFENGVYTGKDARYRVGPLDEAGGWKRVASTPADLTFRHAGGGVIAAIGSCHQLEDVSLEVLTNHLLLGFDERHVTRQSVVVLDGRRALKSRVDGRIDGVPVRLELVVVRKDDCTYDLQLVAGPEVFEARSSDFERFVAAFKALGRSAGSR